VRLAVFYATRYVVVMKTTSRARGRPLKDSKKHDAVLNLRLSSDLRERLDRYCDSQGDGPPRAGVVRRALVEFLNRKEKADGT